MKAMASLHSLRQNASIAWSSLTPEIQKIDASWIIIGLSVLVAAIGTLLSGVPMDLGIAFVTITVCVSGALSTLAAIKSGTLTKHFMVWVIALLFMAYFLLDIMVSLLLLHNRMEAMQ